MGKVLWVYRRTIELKGQMGFVQVPEDLIDAAIEKDCAEDPKGKSSYALKRRNLRDKPISIKAKKGRKKKAIEPETLEHGEASPIEPPVEQEPEGLDEPAIEN